MQKTFKTQVLMSKIFIGVTLGVFLYALYFMTDYQDLFGFLLPVNAPIAQFHDIDMQIFNQIIFFGALFQIILFVAAMILETGRKVPDKFALFILTPMLVIAAAVSVYGIIQLPSLMDIYRNLDFSFIHLESGPKEYTHKYTAFYVGFVVFVINIIANIFYGCILIKSHKTFVKPMEEEVQCDG